MNLVLQLFSASVTRPSGIINSFVDPAVYSLCLAASLVCALFISIGGLRYITSSGDPFKLSHAKNVMRGALIGLIVVLSAATMTTILTHIYPSTGSAANYSLPALSTIQPKPVSNGLVDILIKSITGVLNNIIQTVAQPFLKALQFFTTSTPLLTNNKAVFNLWISLAGIADSLFVLVIALIGFHIMSASSFGFAEIDIRHLLPRLVLIFALINCSLFAIDGVIELSNAMIRAVNVAGATNTVWQALSLVVDQAGGQGIATLLIMVCFLALSVILLVYYVGRLVTIYLGAVLSPLVLLLWLVPGFKEFAESAAKIYLNNIFVLLVHVIILTLAASLFVGLVGQDPSIPPNVLMSMVLGLSTLIALIKTQGVMTQLSYAGTGTRSARRLVGGLFIGAGSLTGSLRNAINNTGNTYGNYYRSPDPAKIVGIKRTKTSEVKAPVGAPKLEATNNKIQNGSSSSKINLPTKESKP